MKLHELHSAEGSRRNRKRVGRGTSSGRWSNAIIQNYAKAWF